MTDVTAPSSLIRRPEETQTFKAKKAKLNRSFSSRTALTATVGPVRLLRKDGKHMDYICWHKSGDTSLATENTIIKPLESQKR